MINLFVYQGQFNLVNLIQLVQDYVRLSNLITRGLKKLGTANVLCVLLMPYFGGEVLKRAINLSFSPRKSFFLGRMYGAFALMPQSSDIADWRGSFKLS